MHLYSTFSVNPRNILLGANLYYHFSRFWELLSHIFKATTVKFGVRVRTWDSLLYTKLFKKSLKGYTPFGKIYTKNTNFGDLGAMDTHF